MAEQSDTLSSGLGRPSRGLYGSDLMVEVLRELGIRYIALNPGASYRGLHDSLVNFAPGEPPEIILCTHEEIAVALANGYTRATGAPMATALHNVVGLLHASMAIFNAWCDRTPMLNLGGGGPQDATLRRSTDWVHTALVQGNLVRDFVKYDDQPYSLESVPESLLRAYRIATTDPKGPVYVCLDADLQEQRMNAPLLVPDARLYRAPAAPAPNPEALREAADLLVKAEWPVIVAGEVGRTPQALVPLRELAETLAAPVIDADGRFAFPNTHPLDLTAVREQTLRAADVVLALDVPSLGVPLGPSVRERETLQLAVRPGTKIVHITLLECERQSFVSDTMWLVPVAVPIAAHTSIALPQLLELCRHQLGSQADACHADRSPARQRSSHAYRGTQTFSSLDRAELASETHLIGAPLRRAQLTPEGAVLGTGAYSWAALARSAGGNGIWAWDRRRARRRCGLRSAGVDRCGLGLQGEWSPLRQCVGRRRFPDDLQRPLDGGSLQYPAVDHGLQQPFVLQRRGASGTDGHASGAPSGQ